MTDKIFIESAVNAFRAYQKATKLEKFRSFVESLKYGADASDLTAINALVEGTSVILEATFTSDSPYVTGVKSLYQNALAKSPRLSADEHQFAADLQDLTAPAPKENDVDTDSSNITRFAKDSYLAEKCSLLKSRGEDLAKQRVERNIPAPELTKLKSQSVYIFIGSLIELMIKEINHATRSLSTQDAEDLFSDYITKVVEDATKVINGTKDRIDLLTNNSYDMRDLQSKHMDISHIYKAENGNNVHVWDWKKLKGNAILNSDKFRSGRRNATAIKHEGQFYIRTAKSAGDIPDDLLDVSPDSEEVAAYWEPTMLYKVGGNSVIGAGDEKQTTVIDKRIDSALTTGDDIGINKRPDIADERDFTDSADEIIQSLFSEEEQELNQVIEMSTKPKEIDAAKAKIAKIHNVRAGFMAKVNARREAADVSADKARNLADTQYASFKELSQNLKTITARQSEIDQLLADSTSKRESLTTSPKSDADVIALEDVTSSIVKLLTERESNEKMIAKINRRLADENRTTETETSAVKKVMGNAQTLDNNMPDIHDDIMKQMQDKGYNINPHKYAKGAGVANIAVFTPEDKAVLEKIATKMELPLKKVINTARTEKTNPRNRESINKLVRVLVDMDDE